MSKLSAVRQRELNDITKCADRIDNDDAFATQVGEEIAELFDLAPRNGRYHTAWGSKTPQGLARTVLRVLLKGVEE